MGAKIELCAGVADNTVTFSMSNSLPQTKRSWWSATYPSYVDLSYVPRELLWMMYALCISEPLAHASEIEIELYEELPEELLKWWRGLIKLNHRANPYGMNLGEECRVEFVNGSRRIEYLGNKPEIKQYKVIAMNGMGKDALCQIGMLRELGGTPMSVMVEHQWAFSSPYVWGEMMNRCAKLQKYHGIKTLFVQTNINEALDLHIMPWYAFSLPLMYLHNVETCYHAMELEFNKYLNGVPIKPNTSVPVLLSMNRVLNSMGFKFEYRSGTVPLSSYGTQKLLVERYPELQKLQTSCMHGFPACNTCPKCQSHMAYLKAMGKDPREYGYNGKIKKEFGVGDLLDIERESQHYALALANGQVPPQDARWASMCWGDAMPYGIPASGRIIRQHSTPHHGKFRTYSKYTYNTKDWDDTAKQICEG